MSPQGPKKFLEKIQITERRPANLAKLFSALGIALFFGWGIFAIKLAYAISISVFWNDIIIAISLFVFLMTILPRRSRVNSRLEFYLTALLPSIVSTGLVWLFLTWKSNLLTGIFFGVWIFIMALQFHIFRDNASLK
ncbi:MAG: hypothetical protein A3F94_00030 [Candidatus Spechtbacteria bacterium RIFCSPLOWO2_12_FULL_38_22]|uniref:Uncharacterized protein n=1 Tax=Candidatus Spechtbacteria bacterium RIFCSPLOWO2_12_FULL_38_22 TaxID=1802165 RepID=A0A1G2HH70_9BACT|nr:MAG: hypothetical protein A2728_02550 [Candidatus Spechtbacteria bacterium RIFCSPHIGHO2_01_FULL_38_11]OGZ59191.1 MAG: hypothetical protein A3E58_00030 [Candidatus Spechtbacteria bacterium RIFCSPHIGHO2_12_FULL_38_30]OGZ60302.1 MAG: hypothetical protein A3A00_01120 [Candidatus Spechtbacteria bacterium RIFCSPLOWO2_01_FULL_38_20]OGZ61610.1 MAG: hypothetical protein A3F94_00030 [Candidatus Spechtbacteria bacterium RIFCSPLOWO2_12_FULL_38_22]